MYVYRNVIQYDLYISLQQQCTDTMNLGGDCLMIANHPAIDQVERLKLETKKRQLHRNVGTYYMLINILLMS